jgi:fatty-acyl-CoA synthase
MSSVWTQQPSPGSIARARVTCSADIKEIERVPYRELLPAWTILGALEASASAAPDKAAIIELDRDDPTRVTRRITYQELVAMIRGTADRLYAVSGGVRPVVSILTPLVPEAFVALWAGATAGIANPINPFLRIDSVAAIMNAAGTTVLVCSDAAYGQLAQLHSLVPTLRAVWRVDSSEVDSFHQQVGPTTHSTSRRHTTKAAQPCSCTLVGPRRRRNSSVTRIMVSF